MMKIAFTLLLPALIAALPMTAASAKNFTDDYSPVTFKDLTEFASRYPVIDLNDDTTFHDYLKATDCETFRAIRDNQFKLQEMKQAALKERQDGAKKADQSLRLYIPVTFLTTGYNFDTQSLNLADYNQLVRVSTFQLLTDNSTPICNERLFNFKGVPASYRIKLLSPVSMRRIPLQKAMAQSLLQRLDRNASSPDTQIIYGNIYLQVEPIAPEPMAPPDKTAVFVRGQVNAINLYVDQDRKIMFKQLNYGEAF